VLRLFVQEFQDRIEELKAVLLARGEVGFDLHVPSSLSSGLLDSLNAPTKPLPRASGRNQRCWKREPRLCSFPCAGDENRSSRGENARFVG
jgi:hypothetical protein